MLLFRSAFNGIGTGAGVAWPLFGVVFSVLGGSIGSLLSITLGSVAVTLFFAVTIPVFYFSYQEMKNKEEQAVLGVKKNQQKLGLDLDQYIASIYEHHQQTGETCDFRSYFKKVLHKDLEDIRQLAPESALHFVLSCLNDYYEDETHRILSDRPALYTYIAHRIPPVQVSWGKLFLAGFFGFVGTFGSIAGCSAGISGLLTGVGIFTSFTAFPILGWAVIAAAVLLGLFIAQQAMAGTWADEQQSAGQQMFKNMHQQLSNALFHRKLTSALQKKPGETEVLSQDAHHSNPGILPQLQLSSQKSLLQKLSFFPSPPVLDEELLDPHYIKLENC